MTKLEIGKTKEEETRATGLFEKFWSKYQPKVGRGAARKSYFKVLEKVGNEYGFTWEQTAEKIMAGLDAQHRHRDKITREFPDEYSRKRAGVFLPHRCNGSTWLNQERWADETPKEKPVEEKLASRCVKCDGEGSQHTPLGTLCAWHWTKEYDLPHLKMLYKNLEKMGLGLEAGQSRQDWSDRCRAYLKTTVLGKALGA